MKKFAILAMVMALQSLACAEPVTERDQKTREKIYDRMAASVFAAYFSIQHSDLPKKEQEKWIHQGANAAFQYWMTTRKGGIRKSKEVDSMIAFFYENAVESKMTAGFSDPLYRMNLVERGNIRVPGFPESTQAQYKEYVEEFQAFLNEALKELQKGRSEPKKILQK